MFTDIKIYRRVDGEKLELFLATMDGVQRATQGAAQKGANEAEVLLRSVSGHRSGASRFLVERLDDVEFGGVDWFVTFDDTESDWAPQIIEMGTNKQAGKHVLKTVFDLKEG